ncbi:hypothetical protein GCM10008959_13150 [Deinococcus seoulensis]|uniref:MHYT domain-containing protein n=1 Tax=Deinococcus seoulensis TaxID=1837379 RepID=A0ABQ2RQP7_9DEIO|nr:MHYT domain-containing protein [Deinococcus seoulensis]GGR53063.1 hypothetical protein GCM10008959_13150 [Deinococcus seoulensis]
MDHSQMVSAQWNSSYIVLSYIIAALASYVSLELAGRAGQNFTQSTSRFWLVAQALVLGYGIWAMHFVGMLAYQVDVAASFNTGLTVFSGLIAVAMIYPALRILHAGPLTLGRLAAAGSIAGLGIVVMHYTGMAAYQMPGTEAQIVWFPLIASVLIAVGASMVAFFLFRLLSSEWVSRQTRMGLFGVKLGAGLVMGAAVIGMHYTGMAALNYHVVDEMKTGLASGGVDTSLLALIVGVVSFLLIGLAVTSILMDAGRGGDLDEMDFGSGSAAD